MTFTSVYKLIKVWYGKNAAGSYSESIWCFCVYLWCDTVAMTTWGTAVWSGEAALGKLVRAHMCVVFWISTHWSRGSQPFGVSGLGTSSPWGAPGDGVSGEAGVTSVEDSRVARVTRGPGVSRQGTSFTVLEIWWNGKTLLAEFGF